EAYKPEYARLLRLRYIDNLSVEDTCRRLSIVERTYKRWRKKSVDEYIKLSS
ncbi:DUF1492 domain-containing protein, partial [Paenibacillus naphthalenovorans]|uniref:DUF1492 domain-containing protein n=1 Tax=Paenibacillus naphthalenovorans TaxID=162209 RepID=UPI003D28C225